MPWRAEGAELAFTYQGEAFGKRVWSRWPSWHRLSDFMIIDADVTDDASLDRAFARMAERMGRRSTSWFMPSPIPTRPN